MESWHPLRSSYSLPDFRASLQALGLDLTDWDEISPPIDDVLCGVSQQSLDAAYPPLVADLRMYLTPAARGLPALRVAFRLDHQGQIQYVAASVREAEATL